MHETTRPLLRPHKFICAYQACTLFAFCALLVTQPWVWSIGLVVVEYSALVAVKMYQGELVSGTDYPGPHSFGSSLLWTLGFYIITNTVRSTVPNSNPNSNPSDSNSNLEPTQPQLQP